MAVAVSAAPTLRLVSFAEGFSSGKPAFADGAGALVVRGAEAGSGSCAAGPAERDGLSKTGRRSHRHDGRLVEARCGSQRVGAQRAQAEENEHRPALHRRSQPQGERLR
jgi:hypothetical protein